MKLGIAFAFLTLSGSVAWPQAGAQRPVVIRSETKVVLVDVVVTGKKGAYVRDLTAKDFRIWEDHKEQTIQSFALESAATGTTSATPQTDYLVLVFDYGGMDADDQIRARQAAARFIDANVSASQLMAVANFDGSLRIAQGFTDNAGRLKDAVTGARSGVVAVNNDAAGTSASTDIDARSRFLALKGLAASLGTAPGRKAIVLLTGSLTASNDQKSVLAEAIEACNRANVAVYPIDVREPSLPSGFTADAGSASSSGSTRTVPGAGRRGSRGAVPLGDSDPAVAADPTGASQQVLFALASGTGGFVIRNAGELAAGLQKIGQEQEEHYILGYTPPESGEKSCHALRVKVDRSGTTVRARSSYCSTPPPELVTASASEKDLEKHAAAPQAGNIGASMRLPFFYVAPGVARVNVAMEIPVGAIKFEKVKGSLHADINILGIASTADGQIGARFSDTLTLDFDEADQNGKDRPVHYEKEFKVAPGQYTFTVAFSAGGESFGKLEQPLTVDPYQPGQFALSALALSKEIRQTAAAEAPLFDDQAPLTVGGVALVPTGSSVFTKSEKAYCYFEIYGAVTDSLTLGLRILDAKSGEPKWDGGAKKLDLHSGGKSTAPVGLTVPIASLAPGSYQLEVTVANGAGKTVRRTAAFDVK